MPMIGVSSRIGVNGVKRVDSALQFRLSASFSWFSFVRGSGNSVLYGWKSLPFAVCIVLRLISVSFPGSSVSRRLFGKLYLDVVAYCSCPFTNIHQFTIKVWCWYINVAHVQLAQYNKQYIHQYTWAT